MTPDEARKLLGGYATGSLSEAEQASLFQAALEDQELFDELAGEHALKEVLGEPGARQRLIAALEPPSKHRAWLWVTAAATVAVAVVIGIVVSQRTPPQPPQQIAQVMKSPEPMVQLPAPPPPVPKQKITAAPTPAPGLRRVSPPAPAPEPPAPKLKKEENAAVAAQADQLQEVKPQAASGALRQFAAAAPAPTIFAFDYAVGADGFLEITPAARGFLLVTASDAVIFPSAVVNAGTAVRMAIPSGSTSLVIAFSRMPGITGAPVRREGSTGRETDQDPPNGRILIQLFLTPGTR